MPQFLIPKPAQHGDLIRLSSDEAHHLRDVFRKQVGERVLLTDGRGTRYQGTIERLDRKEVKIRIEETLPSPPTIRPLKIAQALLKGDRMEWVIQKAVELGVDTFTPFLSSRTIAVWNRPDKIRRWEKIVREAAKQCGRGTQMVVESPISFREVLKVPADNRLLFWEEEGQPVRVFFQRNPPVPPFDKGGMGGFLIVIGPEGGFSFGEVEEARQEGFVILSLGEQTLRAETAAIVSIGLIQYELGNI